MAISFACPTCGKNLKAPDSAVGKSSKCPGCGSRVTCPEPVYEAEIVAAPAGAGAFDDLDEATPYGMAAEPTEAPAVGNEARQPCPMCGEMIIVGAAKCRFCGEVFDEVVKKTTKGGKKARLRTIASQQRNMVICALLQILCYLISGALGPAGAPNRDPALILVRLCISAVLLAALVGGCAYTCMLGSKFFNILAVILLGVLAIVPCLGLISLAIVNQRATRLLQENGYEVSLLGAREP